MNKVISLIFALFISHSCFSQFDGLVINEFMASNTQTITDEEGKYEDWIEIHNTTDSPKSLLGLFLTDNPENIRKWECPDVDVPARGYLLIWADEDGADGELHANFKLSAMGESIHLATIDSTIIDEIYFGEQTADIATGRIPNGTGPFVEVFPTPNAINSLTSINEPLDALKISTYPNPASDVVFFNLDSQESGQIRLLDLNGKLIRQKLFKKPSDGQFDVSTLPNGTYIINFQSESSLGNHKFVIKN